MDRGPAALFGAIVAVGLGPAMLLGVRLGAVDAAPARPPAVVGEHTSGPDQLVGGSGAGDTPLGAEPTGEATPRAKVEPMTVTSTSPSPSATTSPAPVDTTSATASPTPTSTATSDQTTPPTESTTQPSTAPASSPTPAPDPPTATTPGPGDPTGSSTGSGGIGAGGAG